MKIKEMLSQHRRDFTAIFQSELILYAGMLREKSTKVTDEKTELDYQIREIRTNMNHLMDLLERFEKLGIVIEPARRRR